MSVGSPTEPSHRVGQHARITPAKSRIALSEGGSTCKNIECRKTQTLKREVGQHAGMMGQHKQEWWVNMRRNLQSYLPTIGGAGGGRYRYGFNGKETDTETGLQDYGLRIYDRRIGKFLSVDPLTNEYPWNSTYSFAENDVIRNVDLDGAEKMPYMGIGAFKNSGKTQLENANGTTILNFTEFGEKYRVAEYATKLVDEGPFNRQYPRTLYFVQDNTMVNNSDYNVGDGSVIKTAGTHWHFWM